MNSSQRKELYVQGTVTDCEDRVWDIVLILGSQASKDMTVIAIKRSGDRISDHTSHLIKGGGKLIWGTGEAIVAGLELVALAFDPTDPSPELSA